MPLEALKQTFSSRSEDDALIWRGRTISYGELLEQVERWEARFEERDLTPGSAVAIDGDFSPNGAALFLALAQRRCVVVPLTSGAAPERERLLELARVERTFELSPDSDEVRERARPVEGAPHQHYEELRRRRSPGLVLFSSGSTGEAKAIVHDLGTLLEGYSRPRKKKRMRTLTFLLYDHIGGVNTMLHVLSSGGCLVTLEDRNPEVVLRAIEEHRVELLPTSPTFLNLTLLSGALDRYDLSALSLITYGTEPMPESTLLTISQRLPEVRLKQTYGLSEVGIMSSSSRSSGSLWVKLGGDGFQTRVVDGILQIKSRTAMLGYLNADAEHPFTDDGWLNTGDAVEVDGEYLRILGRESELINVGGEKVFPAEVESVIQGLDNIAEVVVYGEPNPITGMIVAAEVTLRAPEDRRAMTTRIKRACREKLAKHKVPVRVKIVDEELHGARFKKRRPLGDT